MPRKRKPATETTDKHKVHEQLQAMLVPVGQLNLDPENARGHDETNIASIKTSLDKFGQRKCLVVKREGMVVIAGNGTLTAAKQLGWTHVAALVTDDDEVTAKAFALADNRTGELANWDYEQLVQDFSALTDVGFDVASLGWDQRELDMLLQSSFNPDAVSEMPKDEGPANKSDAPENPSEIQIDRDSMKRVRVAYYKHQHKGETIGQFVLRAVNALLEGED